MPSEMVKMSAIGGLGGMLPTLSKLATIYVTAQETPLPLPGMYVGLALFFAIGIILCIGFSISDAKQALLVGIAAPGIITNVISGVQHGTTNPAGIPQITLPSTPLKKEGMLLHPTVLPLISFVRAEVNEFEIVAAGDPDDPFAAYYPLDQKFSFSPKPGEPPGRLILYVTSPVVINPGTRTFLPVEVSFRAGRTTSTDLVPVMIGTARTLYTLTKAEELSVVVAEQSAFLKLNENRAINVMVDITLKVEPKIDFSYVLGNAASYKIVGANITFRNDS
jgi:hypothetical protein